MDDLNVQLSVLDLPIIHNSIVYMSILLILEPNDTSHFILNVLECFSQEKFFRVYFLVEK